MNLEVEEYYAQGQAHFEVSEFLEAYQSFKRASEISKDFAEAWHYAGIVLLKLHRKAEGGMYLRRADLEYSKRIQKDIEPDYNYYLKSCIWALLEEKENTIEALKEAIHHNPEYAETALSEVLFSFLLDDEDFTALIKVSIDLLDAKRYKGTKICLNDFTEEFIENRNLFLQKLHQNGWQIDDYEMMLEAGLCIAPQASAEFVANENIYIALHYYLDEGLLYLELQNRMLEDDVQAYRLYKSQNIEELLNVLIDFEQRITKENWEDLVESLIDVCDSVLFELPDGRKVKVS